MRYNLINIFFILFLVSCSDSTEEDLPVIVGSWEVVNEEIKYPDSSWETSSEDCRFDNIEEFKPDGTHILYDGTYECGESGTAIAYGTWRLAANNSQVVFTYDGYAGEYPKTIEELDENTLILSWDTGATSGLQLRQTLLKIE